MIGIINKDFENINGNMRIKIFIKNTGYNVDTSDSMNQSFIITSD